MDKTQKIIDQIADLPAGEQKKIAAAINELLYPPNPEIEQAWIEESRRRLQQIRNGEVETIPGEQVMTELREKFG